MSGVWKRAHDVVPPGGRIARGQSETRDFAWLLQLTYL